MPEAIELVECRGAGSRSMSARFERPPVRTTKRPGQTPNPKSLPRSSVCVVSENSVFYDLAVRLGQVPTQGQAQAREVPHHKPASTNLSRCCAYGRRRSCVIVGEGTRREAPAWKLCRQRKGYGPPRTNDQEPARSGEPASGPCLYSMRSP